MPGKPPISPEQASAIASLRRKGLSQRQVATRVGLSVATVNRYLLAAKRKADGLDKRKARARAKQAEPAQPEAVDVAAPTVDGEPATLTTEQHREILSARMLATERDLKLAEQERDYDAVHRLTRELVQLSGQLCRVEPPPPAQDPNARPDMLAAADRGRAKLWDYVQRAAEGKL